MPADVWLPLRAADPSECPRVKLPAIADVLPWTGPTPTSLQVWAVKQLRYPLGTIIRDTVDGIAVVARIECHSWYGADPFRAPRWHKGTTLYRPAAVDASGKLVVLTSTPSGWPSS
jgi:hypothetical protein